MTIAASRSSRNASRFTIDEVDRAMQAPSSWTAASTQLRSAPRDQQPPNRRPGEG